MRKNQGRGNGPHQRHAKADEQEHLAPVLTRILARDARRYAQKTDAQSQAGGPLHQRGPVAHLFGGDEVEDLGADKHADDEGQQGRGKGAAGQPLGAEPQYDGCCPENRDDGVEVVHPRSRPVA